MARVTSKSSTCHSTGPQELRLNLTQVKQNKDEKPSKRDQHPRKNGWEEKIMEFKHYKEWLSSLFEKRKRRKVNIGEKERD